MRALIFWFGYHSTVTELENGCSSVWMNICAPTSCYLMYLVREVSLQNWSSIDKSYDMKKILFRKIGFKKFEWDKKIQAEKVEEPKAQR